MKACLKCGRLGEWGRCGRCYPCQASVDNMREHDPARKAKKRARYGGAYRNARAAWKELLERGHVTPCGRCGRPLDASMPWDLDHLPDGSLHPSCRLCNRSANQPEENP